MNWILLCLLAGLATADPGSPLERAQELFAQKFYAQSAAELSPKTLEKLPRRELAKAYLLLGDIYEKKGDLSRALGVYQLAVEIFPRDINILSRLAQLLADAELDDRAEPLFIRILAIHPNNAAANMGLGRIKDKQGFYEQAVFHYQIALKDWAAAPLPWIRYAEVLLRRRSPNEALSAIEKALKLDPKNIEASLLKARVQRKQGQKDQAYASLKKTAELAPERPDIRLLEVFWLLEDGRHDACSARLRHILESNPKDPAALWIRGHLHYRAGDENAASRDWLSAAAQKREAPFVAAAAQVLVSVIAPDRP